MPKKEKLTKSVKIRLSDSLFDQINRIAEENHSTLSETIRKILLNKDCSPSVLIQCELRYQKLFNLLQHIKMPQQSREIILQEMNNHDVFHN